VCNIKQLPKTQTKLKFVHFNPYPANV